MFQLDGHDAGVKDEFGMFNDFCLARWKYKFYHKTQFAIKVHRTYHSVIMINSVIYTNTDSYIETLDKSMPS